MLTVPLESASIEALRAEAQRRNIDPDGKDKDQLVRELRQAIAGDRITTPLASQKPEWLTAISHLLTAIAAIAALGSVWYSGILDAKRERLGKENAVLEFDKRTLTQERHEMERALAEAQAELVATKAKLVPFESELRSIERIKEYTGPGEELVLRRLKAEFGFANNNPPDLFLQIESYGLGAADAATSYPEVLHILHESTNVKRLVELRIGYCQLTDDSMRNISECQSLETLLLHQCDITDDLCAEFDLPESIRRLFLNQNLLTSLPGVGTSSIWVTDLSLRDNPIGDDALQGLARHFPTLERLHLDGTSITDAAIKHLRPLRKLLGVTLTRTALSSRGIEELATVTSLRIVKVSKGVVSADEVEKLKPRLSIHVVAEEEADRPWHDTGF